MRVLMVSDFYAPLLGGVEQHVRSLSAELVRRGHTVAVATLWQPGLREYEEDGDVRVYRIRSTMGRFQVLFQQQRHWAPPVPDPEAVLRLRDIVRRELPDIVHGHDWLARSFVPLKPWTGAKFVMGLHYYTVSCARKDLLHHESVCSGPGFRKCVGCAAEHYGRAKGTGITVANWIAVPAEAAAVDLFLPVSRATADGNGLEARKVRYRVLPNFVSVAPIESAVPSHLERYLSQLPDSPFLLFVGDLRRAKGVYVLLEAYAGLHQAPPLVLIGKAWNESPTSFPQNVSVLRDWPNDAVRLAWGRCLMAVIPSIWAEPFGIVAIEAMSSGAPTVASRIGGLSDIVVDRETGILVPPGNVPALRDAIVYLVEAPVERTRMAQAAQHRSRDFQAAKVVPEFELAYASVLSG